MADDDTNWWEDADDSAASKAQAELIARRDALLEARKKLDEERENDPWGDKHTPDGTVAPNVDADKLATALADTGHALGDALKEMSRDLGDVPVVGQPLAAATNATGNAAHGVANLRDRDHDGLTDGQEQARRTDPTNRDTDGDGLADGVEVNTYRSNPKLQDTDRDGRSDWDEASRGISYDREGNQTHRANSDIVTPDPRPGSTSQGQPEHEGPITSPSQVDASLRMDSSFDSAPTNTDWVDDPVAQDAGFTSPDSGDAREPAELDPGFSVPDHYELSEDEAVLTASDFGIPESEGLDSSGSDSSGFAMSEDAGFAPDPSPTESGDWEV